ncbi:MAG TPA: 50S ribosomal protein L10 [Polyangia bacterium]|jgi:large subunit ribosomal protein L10
MDRQTKKATVADLKEKLLKVQSVVLADYRGLTVENVNALRRQFEKAACEYRVVKNTLLSLAVKGTAMEAIVKLLEGPTAIAYSFEDPGAPAKVATTFARQPGIPGKFVIKGGYVDGQILGEPGVQELATMPGKDELRAKLLATLTAAATDFVRLLSAAQQSFVLLLSARERALGEGGETAKA